MKIIIFINNNNLTINYDFWINGHWKCLCSKVMQEKGEYTHISYNQTIGECNIECWKVGEKGGEYNLISHNVLFDQF
jgi:hypothetical protein